MMGKIINGKGSLNRNNIGYEFVAFCCHTGEEAEVISGIAEVFSESIVRYQEVTK